MNKKHALSLCRSDSRLYESLTNPNSTAYTYANTLETVEKELC